MKSVASYCSLSLLLCAYMAANMGIEVHSCTLEGSSKIMLMAGQSPCKHGCCCTDDCKCESLCECIEHNEQCCHTQVYIIQDDQNTVDDVKVVVPLSVLNIVYYTVCEIDTFHNLAAFDLYAATIVFGPGRGLSTCAPLRC